MKYLKKFEELSPELIQRARSSAEEKNRHNQGKRISNEISSSVKGKMVFNSKIMDCGVYGSTSNPKADITLMKTNDCVLIKYSNKKEAKVSEVFLVRPADENDHFGTFRFKIDFMSEQEIVPSNEVQISRKDAMSLISIFSTLLKGCEFKLENNPRKYFKIEEDN